MRACNGCTACCTIMGVPSISKPAYTPCQHATPQGCAIYAARPCDECAGFYCAWLADELPEIRALGAAPLLRDEESPARTDLIVVANESPFYKQTGIPVLVLREARPSAFDAYWGQKLIKRLARKHLLVLVSEHDHRRAIGPPDRMAQFAAYLRSMRK